MMTDKLLDCSTHISSGELPQFPGALRVQRMFIILMLLWLIVSLLLPLSSLFHKAFLTPEGAFAGVDNFRKYFSSPYLTQSLAHTVFISIATTAICVPLAFFFAYALARTTVPGKRFFKSIALLPLFAPTMMHGIALIYLFGNKGIVTTGFFGYLDPLLGAGGGIRVPIYGPVGIIISEIVYTFPQVFLILTVALSMSDYRLYEAAESLGAGKIRRFFSITLPGVKYGLINTLLVSFILSFTDFGAPKVVGGNYNVLATDIYKQVIGQQNMPMGATVGIVLLVPVVLSFFLERALNSGQGMYVTSKALPYRIKPHALRDRICLLYCMAVSSAFIILIGTVFYAALVKLWPYNLSLTMNRFLFRDVAGGGIQPFFNSLFVSLLTALVGVPVTFAGAYLIEKSRNCKGARQASYFLSILPLALPGLVIGLSYIFFFNNLRITLPFTGLGFTNPFHLIYGTFIIIILANIVHFYSVPFISATTTLKKLDSEFELIGESMGIPQYRTFLKVTVPLSLSTIIEMAVYYFVNSMVTISAVIFLYSPRFKLASIAIVNMDDAGDTAEAAAMSALIVLANIAVQVLYEIAVKRGRNKSEAWMKR